MKKLKLPRRLPVDRDTSYDAPPHMSPWPELAFEARMSSVEFRIHERAHITIDDDACRGCSTRECTVACPANLFVPTADGGILFNYENCFECGTCYMVCNNGSLNWSYPTGGHGVVFRQS
ncbi:MAG: ferredoxin family protein [Acidimicrobiia bacterium]